MDKKVRPNPKESALICIDFLHEKKHRIECALDNLVRYSRNYPPTFLIESENWKIFIWQTLWRLTEKS